MYQTGVSFAEFTAGAGYLVEGPTQFNAIQTNLATHASSVPFIRGMFADSLYLDPIAGAIVAVAAINVNRSYLKYNQPKIIPIKKVKPKLRGIEEKIG